MVGIFVLLIAYKIVTGNASGGTRAVAAALVKVEKPQIQTVEYDLRFTGDMIPVQEATIYSKVSGSLEKVLVNIGSRVNTGQLLAVIDTTELRQTYDQTAATYANAKITFERSKELAEQNLVAKQDLDNADAAMKVAEANFAAANTHLEYAHIRAPFSGYITKRELDPGSLVTANSSTLFTLMDAETLKVMVNVLEKDIPSVSRGKEALITVDAFPGRKFTGTIQRLAESVDLSTRTMAVEIDIPNHDEALKGGMFANVVIVASAHENAVTIPTASILKDDQGMYVYLDSSNVAKRARITVGIEQGTKTEVLTGLKGDEILITTGQEFVRNHGQITVQQ